MGTGEPRSRQCAGLECLAACERRFEPPDGPLNQRMHSPGGPFTCCMAYRSRGSFIASSSHTLSQEGGGGGL